MRHKTHDRQHPLTDNPASAARHPDTPGKYISTLLHLILILLTATLTSQAQWDIEESHTTASLRGIHNVGGGVAWASGTHGTVLRTEDGGYLWQTCTIPPGAENLDFRGIQAFDENTAIVMSSGPGDQSRLYKTTDGCQTWRLLFTNPDKEGFWDAVKFLSDYAGYVVGDPVDGSIVLLRTEDGGATWKRIAEKNLQVQQGEALFAASNSVLAVYGYYNFLLATGGTKPEIIHLFTNAPGDPDKYAIKETRYPLSFPSGQSAGAFSLAFAGSAVVVGGDYQDPKLSAAAIFKFWEPKARFTQSTTPPHGYRSSVAYDPTQKLWITVGPNGTDISRDDGRNWQPLKPSGYDPVDADKNWNALSLPFVVGPNGRIGKLRTITPSKP